jgi:hypothetical protein
LEAYTDVWNVRNPRLSVEGNLLCAAGFPLLMIQDMHSMEWQVGVAVMIEGSSDSLLGTGRIVAAVLASPGGAGG